ncbi:hypothetical protein J2T58_001303 [Methanocalculus alkaliphilus]|uniref:hypothetical protein n=1 Tax=Methanocalculus alkaliphilus TaxID=768730 RepID=UPI0020A1B361|nr:hypothetical protein [Methanocalculus alkaliphilus]MCP1715438.1 hypothetical protein [Methanocalculus alkaliphilus]
MAEDFHETQYFRHPVIIAIVGGTATVTWYTFITEVQELKPLQLFILGTIGIIVPLLFLTLRLETHVSSAGIRYRMPPVVRKERTITWSDLEKADLTTVRPIRDCGGWGIRFCRGQGIAYLVSGADVLRCTLRSGQKVLLGTKRGGEMMAAVEAHQR